MTLLEQTADVVKQWGPERADDRKQCLSLLEQAVNHMDAAITEWDNLQQEAPETGNAFTAILSIGTERSKKLFQIHQEQKELGEQLTALTGIAFKDTMGIADEIDIVQAYGQLNKDETVVDRAQTAIETMKKRKQRIAQTIAQLRE